ncbi:MAG: hypothetical protein HYZ28_01190 [Myxococcales bacterium]|nr:hypothetical protein [Myxococcales bacterium]
MKRVSGVLAALTLVGSVAFAEEPQKEEKRTEERKMEPGMPATGGAGEEMRAKMGATQITGEVVKLEKKTLYLEHMGAVIPFQLDKDVKFEGLTRADLREGEQVRASFMVHNRTNNVVTTIARAEPGTGGALEEMLPREEMREKERMPEEQRPPTQNY